MSISTVFLTLVIVVGVFFACLAIVATDPAERPLLKMLLGRLLPVGYGLLSVFAFLWLVSRDFSPFGGLGSRLLVTALNHSTGDSYIRFFVSWLGAPIVGLADVLIMLAILIGAWVFTGWGLWTLIMEVPALARVFGLATKRTWYAVLDLFIHPPSIKTIRETLRSREPSAERVRKIATVLVEERDKVMNKGIPAEIIKSYARKHQALAKELSVAQMKARAEYNDAIAKTARGLQDSAVRRGRASSGEGRDD